MTKSAIDHLDVIDNLNQLRDETRVVWLALTNTNHAEQHVGEIGELVNSIANRLADVCEALSLLNERAAVAGGKR